MAHYPHHQEGMGTRRITTSVGKFSQSMGSKEICILILNDDLTCCNIVNEMLSHCSHEVLHTGSLVDVLNAIRARRETLDFVVAVFLSSDADGSEISQQIRKEFKLTTYLLCPGDTKNVKSTGQPSRLTAYVLQSLSINDISDLWQHALAREKGKMVEDEAIGHAQSKLLPDTVVETIEGNASFMGEATRHYQKRKRKEFKDADEQNEGSATDDSPMEKKPRVIWNEEMHLKFLEAVQQLGGDKGAFPKKIVEIMNVPGLTRENVASHLQKYRICLKRTQEGQIGFMSHMCFARDAEEPCYSSGNSPLNFEHSRAISVQNFMQQQQCWKPLQQGSGGTISPPAPKYSGFPSPELSINMPNFRQAKLPKINNEASLGQLYIKNKPCPNAALLPQINYTGLGNLQQTLQNLAQAAEFRHASGPLANQSFKTYGDKRKSVLVSTETGTPSGSKTNHPVSPYVGFRLANDGKALAFGVGQPSTAAGNDDSREEMEFSECLDCISQHLPSLPTAGMNENLDPQRPTCIDFSPQSQPSQPFSGSLSNEGPILHPSLLLDTIPETQHQQMSLVTPWNDSSVQYIPATIESMSQQQAPSVTLLGTSANNSIDPHPQASLQGLMAGNENPFQNPSTSLYCLPKQEVFLFPLINEGSGLGQNISTSYRNTSPPQTSQPLNESSVEIIQQHHSDTQLMQDLDSTGMKGNNDLLLQETESTSSLPSCWNNFYDDSLFN